MTVAASWAQTTRDEMLADPLKCSGLYMPYPDSIAAPTPVPDGYEPFYVGHYGRHGSRYLGADDDYNRVIRVMIAANEAGQLTDKGRDVFERMKQILLLSGGRGGELAPLGYRQHREIASRLYDECRAAFDGDAEVTAVSTVYMRCAHSMFAFVGRLKELCPDFEVSYESSNRHMCYMSHLNPEAKAFNNSGAVNEPFARFRGEMINPYRFTASLFVDPSGIDFGGSQSQFMWWFYLVAIDMPNLDSDIRLFDVFTPEELFNLWQVFNYEYYTYHSGNPMSNGVFIESAKPLLQSFLSAAQSYVAKGKHGATLRFGHDSSVIPLAGLLRFPVASARESDPSKLYSVYTDWRVSPMASNIQMRLYRNASGDVIAKFMLNEQEMPLPDTATDMFPYYRWSDVCATLQRLLDSPCN